MNSEQLIRIDKVYCEPLYLLDNKTEDNKIIYKVSGSTNNIYNVQIYTSSKKIYCNCPDSKKWAQYHNVICKHSCFILLKVLKIIDHETYFQNYVLTNEQIEDIKTKNKSLNLNLDSDYVNHEYIKKFRELKNNDNKSIILKENHDTFCVICYDEFKNILDVNENKQCRQCLAILHKNCLQKWLNMGKSTCPYCRTTIQCGNSYYKNLFD